MRVWKYFLKYLILEVLQYSTRGSYVNNWILILFCSRYFHYIIKSRDRKKTVHYSQKICWLILIIHLISLFFIFMVEPCSRPGASFQLQLSASFQRALASSTLHISPCYCHRVSKQFMGTYMRRIRIWRSKNTELDTNTQKWRSGSARTQNADLVFKFSDPDTNAK